MKKVLFVVGSLREGSFNKQLAAMAEKALAGKAEVSYLDFTKLPLMNQDIENPVLPEVQAIRDEASAADAIWFFSPVYNFSIPGTIKNLIDWLSRSLDPANPAGESAIHNKFTTVSAAGAGGFENMFENYKFLLPFVRTQVIDEFTEVKINDSAWVDGQLVLTDEAQAQFDAQVAAVIKAINA